jgi:hypothetical protein
VWNRLSIADVYRVPARRTSLRPSTAETTGPHGCVEVLVHVRLAPTTPPATFERYLHSEPGVLQVWHTAGDIDFEIHLHCHGISDLHDLLTRARSVGGAQETTTHLILSQGFGLRAAGGPPDRIQGFNPAARNPRPPRNTIER